MLGARAFGTALMDLALPRWCLTCGTGGTDGFPGYLCGDCGRKIRPLGRQICVFCGDLHEDPGNLGFPCTVCQGAELQVDAARAPFVYEPNSPLAKLIVAYKHERLRGVERDFQRLVGTGLIDYAGTMEPDLLVPVPLSRQRYRERGFNQAATLTRALGGATLGALLREDVLRRRRHIVMQEQQTALQRVLAIRGAFEVPNPALVAGKRILLVDDVFTTGATLNGCAEALLEAGAEMVAAWTLARTRRSALPATPIQ